jgi:hypothetical protein
MATLSSADRHGFGMPAVRVLEFLDILGHPETGKRRLKGPTGKSFAR